MATESKYHWFYKTDAWQKRRSWQLRHFPLCERCHDLGRITQATIAHHKARHQGSWHTFISSALASLCKECHDSIEQSIERLGYSKAVDVNGKPIDKDHPTYSAVYKGKTI